MRPASTETQLLDVYRTMWSIRAFEYRVHDEFATGGIPGFVHLYAGEEASATGVARTSIPTATPSRPPTAGTVTHRQGRRHRADDGRDLRQVGGLLHGKGGSMHIADLTRGCSAPMALSAAVRR